MKKTLLLATIAMLDAPAAFADDAKQQNNAEVKYKDDGGYVVQKNGEQVDSNGAKHTTNSKTEVDYDANGNMKKTVVNTDKVKTGVLHSKENQSKTEYQQTNDGGYMKTTTSDHTNTDGTNIETTSKTHVGVDANGNDVAVTKTKSTIDPPGLMNKTTSTTATKTVNGVPVESTSGN